MLEVGVVTRSFHNMTIEECSIEMSKREFSSTEVCFTFTDADYWQYNGRKDMSGLTAKIGAKVVDAFRSKGIEVVSIGAFSNLLEKDPTERKEIFAVYQHYLDIASDNGVPFVATECGFIPGRRGINADTYESDYSIFTDNLKYVLDMAEKSNAAIAFEPCVLDVVPSAKRTRDLIMQLGSDKLRILLDPANLIANSSEEDMYFYLSDYLAYMHGKDRKINDAYGRNLGEGDIDWKKYFSLYRKCSPDIPFILEYVNIDNCEAIKRKAEEYYIA